MEFSSFVFVIGKDRNNGKPLILGFYSEDSDVDWRNGRHFDKALDRAKEFLDMSNVLCFDSYSLEEFQFRGLYEAATHLDPEIVEAYINDYG